MQVSPDLSNWMSELEYKKNIFVVASGPGAERVREYTATVDSL